jgi:UDP-N-acetylglucosamine acyltransferase
MLDIEQIRDVLPHRYPFLLVDRILELSPEKSARGYKNVTINEEFFEGHFPGHAVMPGVLVCEAMAQVSGVLLLSRTGCEGKLAYFGGMDKVRFRKPVLPGDTLVTDVELIAMKANIGKVRAVARVDGEVACEGEFMFALVGRDRKMDKAPVAVVTTKESKKTDIHPTAIIDPTARIGQGASVGAHSIIGKNVCIGDGAHIDAHVLIESNVTLGKDCVVLAGSVIGGAPQDKKYHGEDSYVKIGDGNIIREYVTIHRASGDEQATVLGDGNMLMAYCHVGHNCKLGNNITMANYVGISGHVIIEDKVVFGGFVGVHQKVRIGKLAMIGGMSKVVQDVPPFAIVDGRPIRVCDLNVIGLRRNNISAKVRSEIRHAYKLLYRSNLNVTQAIEAIEREIEPSEDLTYLLDFIKSVREGSGGRQLETPEF